MKVRASIFFVRVKNFIFIILFLTFCISCIKIVKFVTKCFMTYDFISLSLIKNDFIMKVHKDRSRWYFFKVRSAISHRSMLYHSFFFSVYVEPIRPPKSQKLYRATSKREGVHNWSQLCEQMTNFFPIKNYQDPQ